MPDLRGRLGRTRTDRSGGAGPLPAFVVVGAMKAGTTSLKANLRRHPAVYMPGREIHFFDKYWGKGIGWYRQQFVRGEGKLCGEKTPTYMTDRAYMERLHDVLPDAKIVALLRDPAARLFSHINHRIQRGKLPEPEVIDVAFLEEHILRRPKRMKEYVERGYYVDQIKENILPFFPSERVFIRATDAWSGAVDRSALDQKEGSPGQLRGTEGAGGFTEQLQHDLQDFLGLERWEPPAYKVAGVRSYKATVTPEARARARELYADANERLFAFLGYPIPEWTRPAPVTG